MLSFHIHLDLSVSRFYHFLLFYPFCLVALQCLLELIVLIFMLHSASIFQPFSFEKRTVHTIICWTKNNYDFVSHLHREMDLFLFWEEKLCAQLKMHIFLLKSPSKCIHFSSKFLISLMQNNKYLQENTKFTFLHI